MNFAVEQLLQTISNLEKKAEAIDEIVKDLRIEINSLFWDLKESKTKKDGEENK